MEGYKVIDETVKWCQHKIRMDVIKWELLRKKLMEYAITVLERLVGKMLREIVETAETQQQMPYG